MKSHELRPLTCLYKDTYVVPDNLLSEFASTGKSFPDSSQPQLQLFVDTTIHSSQVLMLLKQINLA
jgi:hypothetical protein